MTNRKFTGYSLMLGGVLYLIANSILTIQLPQNVPGPEVFASDAFLYRLSVAAAAVFFLLIGALGIYSRQSHQTRWFGALAFGLTFVGCMFVFAHEWAQVFFLHELAQVAPQALDALEDVEGFNLYDTETILGLVAFMVGWLLLAASMLATKVFRPIGPWMLIGGFLAVPVLAAVLPAFWGFIAGNVVVGIAWVLIGLDLSRVTDQAVATTPPIEGRTLNCL